MLLKLLYFLITFFVCEAYGSMSHLSCSKNGTHLVFINGVDVSNLEHSQFQQEAIQFFTDLNKLNLDASRKTSFSVPHNRSEGRIKDIAETFFLFANRDKSSSLESRIGFFAARPILQVLVAGLMTDRGKLDYLCREFISRDSNGDLINDVCKHDTTDSAKTEISVKDACCAINDIIVKGQKSVTFEDLGKFRTDVVQKLKNNEKVILVTHSAGAMFADRIIDYIKRYHSEYQNYIGNLAIARPFKTNHCKGNGHCQRMYYLNSQRDPILNSLRDSDLNETSYPNTFFSKNCQVTIPFPLDYRNHEFSCYLSETKVTGGPLLFNTQEPTSRYYIEDYIYRVASDLGNNDENCCNKAPGRMWKNDLLCEFSPEECSTSFIANPERFKVKDDSELRNSFICGDYDIDSEGKLVTISNSRFLGKGTIKGEFGFGNSTLEKDSVVDIHSASSYFFLTNFKGTSRFSGGGKITFDTVQLTGNNEFKSDNQSSWLRLWRTNIISDGSNENYISASGTIDTGIRDSTLGNKFELDLYNSSIFFSNMLGDLKVNGRTYFYNFHNDGIVNFFNTISSQYSYVVHARNEGQLNITGPNVKIENIKTYGTNNLTAQENGNSMVYNVDLYDSVLKGNYYVNPANRQNMKNLFITNFSSKFVRMHNNSWEGSLTLNGSIQLGENQIGRNVVINAPNTARPQEDLALVFSNIPDSLIVTESGELRNCIFEGSGYNYTKTCTGFSNLFFNKRFDYVSKDFFTPENVHETKKQFEERLNRLKIHHSL